MSLALAGGFLSTVPPGKSLKHLNLNEFRFKNQNDLKHIPISVSNHFPFQSFLKIIVIVTILLGIQTICVRDYHKSKK